LSFALVPKILPSSVLRLVTFVALGVLVGPTYADADLWGHVRFGLDMLSAGHLTSVDQYSFTSDVMWVNHEWLAEALFALGYKGAGQFGLIAIKLAVLAGVVLLTEKSLRDDVPSVLVRDFFVGLVVLLTSARTGSVRPQLFSVLLFTLLVVTLRSTDRGDSRGVILLPPLFALWANLHGAWITGLCVLGIWCALASWSTLAMRAALFVSCALATLINPYGYGLWDFLRTTVGTSRAEINDWMPLFSMPWPIVAYECILPLLAVFAIVKTRRISLAYGAILFVLAVATYRISRVDAFLHTAIVILIASQIAEALGASASRAGVAKLSTQRFAPALAAFLVVATLASRGTIPIVGPWTPDASAIDAIRASGRARLLTWFDWGEYAIWHLSPSGIGVSMDGRRETVYSERTVDDHFAFYRAKASHTGYADVVGADLVWLPAELPIVPVLKQRGWSVAYESQVSVVLERTQSGPRIESTLRPEARVFPGP
jgi:hypothetical protein